MNQKEFENMAIQLRKRSLAVALGFGFGNAEAEDVAQDTLLKLWQLRSSTDGSKAAEAIAVSIARHLCIDITRRRRTIPIDARPVADDRYATPDTALETAENERWLQQRLEALPDTEHAVLHLRQVERKDNAEIAAILGIAMSSVPTILSRARHKILADFMRRQQQ